MATEVDPLDVLTDDLKHDSVEIQLEAARALLTIALALGPERTANELFAALEKYCFPVEVMAAKSSEAYSNTEALAAKEEVLAAIAEELGPKMVAYCGGSHQAAAHMLPLLEKMCMVEETVIRQAAVTSMTEVFSELDVAHVKQAGMGILQQLASADWFTSRVSASGLTSRLYRLLKTDDDRTAILAVHKKLCSDDMPMVKHDAFKNLVSLIDNMDNYHFIVTYARPLLEQLQHELMENMRQTMVDITKKIAEKSEDEKTQTIVFDFVKVAVDDESWRVRKHCAEELPNICRFVSNARVNEDILPLYMRLLTDSEPQVRKASIAVLDTMVKNSDGQIFAAAICEATLATLVADTVSDVREALADKVTCLGEGMSEAHVQEKLLPSLKKLAGDDSPLARLNLCSHLGDVATMLGIELFESDILPLLKEVTIDQKWRVRNSIVTNIAHIGSQMGKDRFAKSRLKDILVQSLKDPASKVRETAAEQVHVLHEKFGFDWMAKYLFPAMKNIFHESGNYLHRMIPLKAVHLMAPRLTSSQVKAEFVELITNGLKDNISNVRFTACRVLEELIPRLESDIVAPFRTQLVALVKEDTDSDVKFFAQEALAKCG